MTDLFEFQKVQDDTIREEVYRLRYKVYCDEWRFERPEDHPGGIERDVYDPHSVHFIARRKEDQQIIGTVRIILHSKEGFPLQRHCALSDAGTQLLSGLDASRGGEISRLAVSKEYRRRNTDKYYETTNVTESDVEGLWDHRRRFENNIVVGLYRCVYEESLRLGLTHIYAVMARGLFLIMRKIGIIFDPIGPGVEYHGLRTPYVGIIENMLGDLKAHNPDLFKKFMNDFSCKI